MPAPTYDDGGSAGAGANSEGAPGAVDGHFLKNAAAGNGASFQLTGGLYAISTVATGTGTIDLAVLGPDGSTWLPVMTQITATTKFQTQNLPPGTYRWQTATFTAIYATVSRVPQA